MHCHNVEKPYLCMECDKRFVYKFALKRHKERHNTQKLTYHCIKCTYNCESKQSLTDHEIAHSSDKSFSCKKCEYKTISNVSLSKHIRERDHGDIYKCKECNSEFRFLNSFTKHANEVHKDKEPFTCSICDKYYSTKTNLTKHMKTHTAHVIVCKDSHNEISKCDENNNQEQINNETIISIHNLHYVDRLENKCVSCKKNMKLKKKWPKWVIDDRRSFELNEHLCELALKQWEVSWDINCHQRICLACKLNLVSGKNHSLHSKKRGRPNVKQIGFVTVCSTCHTEVKRTNKKHTCSNSRTKRNIKTIINKSSRDSKIVPKQERPPILYVNADDLNIHQSISRLSSRQMHKQKLLWKDHLKD